MSVPAPVKEETWEAEASPRVLLFSPNFVRGAASWGQSLGLACRLPEFGWPSRGISTFPSRARRLADVPLAIYRHRRVVDAALVDVFSGQAFLFAEWACGWLSRARIPFALVLRGGHLPDYRQRWPRRVARLLRRAAVVVAPSAFLREAFRSVRDDIEVIPNAIDTHGYRFALQEPHPPSLVWVRAFHEIYHPELAIRVLAELREVFPDLMLTMGGPEKTAELLPSVKKLARELDVAERVRFLGPIPKAEMGGILGRHTLYLNTPRIDNTPVTVIEAMASGCAVVSTRVGGTAHLIEDGVNGLLVPEGDAPAMARAAAELIRNPVRLRAIASAALKTARASTWSGVLPAWVRLLDGMGPQPKQLKSSDQSGD